MHMMGLRLWNTGCIDLQLGPWMQDAHVSISVLGRCRQHISGAGWLQGILHNLMLIITWKLHGAAGNDTSGWHNWHSWCTLTGSCDVQPGRQAAWKKTAGTVLFAIYVTKTMQNSFFWAVGSQNEGTVNRPTPKSQLFRSVNIASVYQRLCDLISANLLSSCNRSPLNNLYALILSLDIYHSLIPYQCIYSGLHGLHRFLSLSLSLSFTLPRLISCNVSLLTCLIGKDKHHFGVCVSFRSTSRSVALMHLWCSSTFICKTIRVLAYVYVCDNMESRTSTCRYIFG